MDRCGIREAGLYGPLDGSSKGALLMGGPLREGALQAPQLTNSTRVYYWLKITELG